MRHDRTTLRGTTPARPCPVCEGTDGCSAGADGSLLCRRRQGTQPGFVHCGPCKGDPQWTVYRREGDPLLNSRHHGNGNGTPFGVVARNGSATNGAPSRPATNWPATAETLARQLTPDTAAALAQVLGLPVYVLGELEALGYSPGDVNGPCWTFPETDGAGNVIGLNRRYCSTGEKRAWPGGKRGLTVPRRWREREGPIFLPEGASDVLALTAFDLAAVGRPSNTAGVEHLAELLRDVPADRQIVVLGETDTNDKGQWPGRDGAVSTAAALQEKLGRPVFWALPPDGKKDARAWMQAQRLPREGDGIADDWQEAGWAFKEKVLEKLNTAAPIGGANPTEQPTTAAADSVLAFRWAPIASDVFASTDYRPAWLIKHVLVAMQPAVLGGAQKVLKTTLALDQAICLAASLPFLGKFDCPARKRCAVLSGESGRFTLQETARRICAAKGFDLADLGDMLTWQFILPQLANLGQLDAFRIGLERDQVDVVFIDPLYLSLLAGGDGAVRAENLYETGPLLMRVAQACLSVGATPVLVHHTRKGAGTEGEPLDLTDLAFSGIAEFARQWLLLSRREALDPDSGQHRLWLAVGGSVGHHGLYAVDVDEGQLADDFTGRKWDVVVKPAAEARAEKKDAKADVKAEAGRDRDRADETALLAALPRLANGDGVAAYGRVRDLAGLNTHRMSGAFERLLADGTVERVVGLEIQTANGGTRKNGVGIRRRVDR